MLASSQVVLREVVQKKGSALFCVLPFRPENPAQPHVIVLVSQNIGIHAAAMADDLVPPAVQYSVFRKATMVINRPLLSDSRVLIVNYTGLEPSKDYLVVRAGTSCHFDLVRRRRNFKFRPRSPEGIRSTHRNIRRSELPRDFVQYPQKRFFSCPL